MEPLKQEMKPLTKIVSEWVHEYFKSTDLQVSEDGDRATYEFTGEDGGDFKYKGYVEVYEDRFAVEVYLYAPISVPERKRRDVAELLARINYCLPAGHISLDFGSGKLRYKGALEVKDGVLSVSMVDIMVSRGMSMLDHYLPTVLAVAHANVLPADAFAALGGETSNKGKLPLPDAGSLKNVWPWEHFVGNTPLREFAEDLRRTIESKGNQDVWALTGRAVVLMNEKNFCRQALRRVAVDAGMQFIYIPGDEVMDMPPVRNFRSMSPALVFLEPGRWMYEEGDEDESKENAEAVKQFQSKLAEELEEFNPAHPVVFASSARKIDYFAEKLRRVGAFERFISLADCPLESIGMDFIERLGRELCAASILESPGKVGRLISWDFEKDEQCNLAILGLKRIGAREKRQLEFLDLVHLAIHQLMEEGLVQPASEATRKNTAYHEAGHAVMRVLESDGTDIPDYTSILPGASGFAGITASSYEYSYSTKDEDFVYKKFRRRIRILLAGRAGEELLGGAENVSDGASNDLEKIWNIASQMFAGGGFAPSMEKMGQSESNLAVIVGKASVSESAHVEKLVREFAAEEYRYVLQTLTKHRALMDDVAARLLCDPVVDQSELAEICNKHGVEANGCR